jgi:ribosomal protein S18 acetylase RimI-like enzyme
MLIKSLGFQTNLIFSRFSGSVEDRGSYTLIKTPTNPEYHWGNFIIFDQPPQKGDLEKWRSLFDCEFEYYQEPHHYVFAWDLQDDLNLDVREFLAAGFKLDSTAVLTTSRLNPPRHFNKNLEIRKLVTDSDWDQVVQLQNLCADPKYVNDAYFEFKRQQMSQYRKMSEAGLGFWFGAFIGKTLVGDLGIFHERSVGRYQSIETHPEYRRQGVCGTLAYESGQTMIKEADLKLLVIEADPEYHAARIYESIGFQGEETNYSLSWWRGKENIS